MHKVSVPNSENPTTGDRSKGLKVEKCTTVGTVARKRLADISNITQKSKSPSKVGQAVVLSNKLYIEKIQKENMKLVEIIADRNKLIEYTGAELQKSLIGMQQLQQQNLLLAQENSKMLGELNSCKDRLKALNHELGCKNSLIKALQSEKTKLPAQQEAVNKVGTNECDEAGETYRAVKLDKCDDRPCNIRRTRQSNYQALASAEVSLTAVAAGTSRKQVEKKRPRLTRQSARFKPEVPEKTEDGFEINDVKYPVHPLHDDQMNENTPTPSVLTVKEDSNPSYGAQEFRRTSVGRPLRRAVEKVQSYKEMNLRDKMRKPE